ncbi:YkgJ family cysteine cluster protein [Shewanella sp. WPAGA9]|uniref:YkgJ family cysteine cluster protein n=1 Tax=Shewanella sp. ENK2 TaxID=2775245 RepID=UPI00177C1153|nr:YkgJ family cysteine cluster protein [Shewanella sp. WPAGA9]
MKIDINEIPSQPLNEIDPNATCITCKACCCKLEVMIISDTGVPDEYISEDSWGGQVMKRLDDGWCAAVDRGTLMCTIYENRPWICREFEMGSFECVEERKQLTVED